MYVPYAALAQSVEQQFCKLWVPSSILGGGSKNKSRANKNHSSAEEWFLFDVIFSVEN